MKTEEANACTLQHGHTPTLDGISKTLKAKGSPAKHDVLDDNDPETLQQLRGLSIKGLGISGQRAAAAPCAVLQRFRYSR
jgi:hypothetical protein